MTRLFNFAMLFLLAGIYYIQTDGFGAGSTPANASSTEVAKADTSADTSVQKVALHTETPTLRAPANDLPSLPIVTNNVDDLTGAEKEAIVARFNAERLTSSTVIRTAKATKKPTEIDTPNTATIDTINTLKVAGNVVNARSAPSTSSDIIAKLRRNTEVVSTGQADGKWAEVIVIETGQSVWMHSDFLTNS